MKMNDLTTLAFLSLALAFVAGQGLPSYLIPCYRSNNTSNFVAQSDQIFLQLIRKIEDTLPTSLDMRILSASLFHRLRFDGIQKAVGVSETEFVTPYRNNGIMAPKLTVLKRLISVAGNVPFENILTEMELCTLHKLLSTSVDPFERGDETRTCPTYSMPAVEAPWITGNIKMINDSFRFGGTTRNIVKFGRAVSRCPIEMGVARTDFYGDVSLGTLVGAIAAGLEPQAVQIRDLIEAADRPSAEYKNLESMDEVPVTKKMQKLFRNLNTLDNRIAAGLASDLAEVCVYQTPYLNNQFVMGTSGTWNDTVFPRLRLLEQNHRARWEFSEAEILAGLDSYFIGRHVQEWVNQIRRLRLSQVVEMYYSSRGIPVRAIETSGHKSKTFGKNHLDYTAILEDRSAKIGSEDEISSGCDRKKILNSIDVGQLQDETYNFAQVLQFTATTVFISDEKLRSNCDIAVNMFMKKAQQILNKQTQCNNIPKVNREVVVDLQLSIDGSRREYENLQLVNHMAHISRMSSYGTNMMVIHGQTGDIMANRTNNSVTTFEELRKFNGRYPTAIALSPVLQTVLNNLRNRTEQELLERRICAPSHVVLIMSQGTRVGTNDFTSAQRMINSTFQRFPDLYFIFVTNDKSTFLDLTKSITAPSHWSGNRERFNELIYPEHFSIIESNSLDPLDFSERVAKELRRIPKRIIAPFCLNAEDLARLHKQNILFRPDEYEDYVGPNQENLYRISPFYFRYANEINVQFHGVGYGDLTICQSRNLFAASDYCQTLKGDDVVWFNATAPCPNPLDCPSLYYSVSMDVSRMRCSENDCRYPDQVRYFIRHHGLTCENGPSGAISHRNPLIGIIVTTFVANLLLAKYV